MKKKWTTLLLCFLSLAAVLSAQGRKKPNILFIHTDDLGYHDLSFTGSKIYQTPNIDRLAAKSLTFEQAYSSYPRCVPSRYGMMTCTYPVNEDNGNLSGIPKDKSFIRHFTDAGYNSIYVGKWHLGEGENSPEGFGFAHSYAAGNSGGAGSHFYPFNVFKGGENRNEDGDGARVIENVQQDGKEGDYLADLLTTQTMKFIRDNGNKKPFFAMLAYYAVHTPLEAKPEDRERNKKEIAAFDWGNTPEFIPEGTGRRKMRQNHPDYAGMVENVDWNVGRLLTLLKEMKIDKNTIVIFSSDHGGLSNDGSRKRDLATTNNPLRAGKGHLYEGGLRVPLIIHWNKKIKPGVDTKNIILGMDLFPTLTELVLGKKIEGVDGKSYCGVLSKKEDWSNRTVYWHEEKARPQSTGDTKCSAIRSGDYKLMHFYADNIVELYNVRKEISEETNLAKSEPELTKSLLSQLNDWKKTYLVPEKMNMKRNARQNPRSGSSGNPQNGKD